MVSEPCLPSLLPLDSATARAGQGWRCSCFLGGISTPEESRELFLEKLRLKRRGDRTPGVKRVLIIDSQQFSESLLNQPFPQPSQGLLSNKDYKMVKVSLLSKEFVEWTFFSLTDSFCALSCKFDLTFFNLVVSHLSIGCLEGWVHALISHQSHYALHSTSSAQSRSKWVH